MLYQNDPNGIFMCNLCCKVRVFNKTTVVCVNLLILFPELYSLHYLLGKKEKFIIHRDLLDFK